MRPRHAVLLTSLEFADPDCLPFYQQIAPVTSLESALTRHSQLTENTATLSPSECALTDFSPATPLECALTKNIGRRGVRPSFPARNAHERIAHLPFFSTTCAMPLAQLLSFDNDPFSWGWGPLPPIIVSHHYTQVLFSHSSALFCACQKLNSLSVKQFRTLFQKHPAWEEGGAC